MSSGTQTEDTVVLARNAKGALTQREIELRENVKPKRYRKAFRTVFCGGLLARRTLIAAGPTEASAFSVVCRRLAELDPEALKLTQKSGHLSFGEGGADYGQASYPV
ncbi:hypothetical protein J8I87_42800, partial [Paraburkholderia sp. LEh10]|nr:hypothetical protein [Paraburkholderia sp. LEh10]